jgi:hypothetical protein
MSARLLLCLLRSSWLTVEAAVVGAATVLIGHPVVASTAVGRGPRVLAPCRA